MKSEIFEHEMTVYVADALGFEIPESAFTINLLIMVEKIEDRCLGKVRRVTIKIPSLNFITGPYANNEYETDNPLGILLGASNFLPPPQNGGYLYTKDGQLPSKIRPTDLLTQAYTVGSNNGQNLPFLYQGNSSDVTGVTYTPPPTNYLLRITNAGSLVLEGSGTLFNIIPPGTQQVLPTTISYLVQPQIKLCKNTRISTGAINIAQFGLELNKVMHDNVRDHHVNDVFDNVVAYAWTDNSNVNPNDPLYGDRMNLAYAIGTVCDGKIKIKYQDFMNIPNELFAWDTSIAINRKNKDHIVIFYLETIFINGNFEYLNYTSVTFDGGKTWKTGPIQPSSLQRSPGDVPGVRADKYGNFWAITTIDDTTSKDIPFVIKSTDGIHWDLVYTFISDDNKPNELYDYPAFTFGGDGKGNYGLQAVVDYFPDLTLGSIGYPSRVFIPINPNGSYGFPEQVFLSNFTNNNYISSITASEDGRVWLYGESTGIIGTYVIPGGHTNDRMVYKSPGDLDQNYAGPWGVMRYNQLNLSILYPVWKAIPGFAGFFKTVQTNLYDDQRQALYQIASATYPENSDNSRLYFMISRNNGLTWSNPIPVNTSDKSNRGFPSMALDSITGNLLIGWYDARNYDNFSLNYYGAVINSKTLDKLVKEIPLSNPTFEVPKEGYDPLPPSPLSEDVNRSIEGNPRRNRHKMREEIFSRLKEKLQKA